MLSVRDTKEPMYLRIAEALEAEIASGLRPPGNKLPTHRELAAELGVTVSTVSRAYGELIRKEIVIANKKQGTVVAPRPTGPRGEDLTRSHAVNGFDRRLEAFDLRENRPLPLDATLSRRVLPALEEALREEFANLRNPVSLERLLPLLNGWRGRVADIADAGGDLVPTAGTQHGLYIVLADIAEPGDTVLADEFCYSGVKLACAKLGLRLVGVAADRHGMRPDALETSIRDHGARAVFLQPTFHSPTGLTMPRKRRKELARVMDMEGCALIEDDIYAALTESPLRPVASMLEKASGFYCSSMSKALSPLIRLGYIWCPSAYAPALRSAVKASLWRLDSFSLRLFEHLAATGWDMAIAKAQREALRARFDFARSLMGEAVVGDPGSPHIWLRLPDVWRVEAFMSCCQARDIFVLPPGVFALGGAFQNAVRVSLNAMEDQDGFRNAMRALALLVQSDPMDVSFHL